MGNRSENRCFAFISDAFVTRFRICFLQRAILKRYEDFHKLELK